MLSFLTGGVMKYVAGGLALLLLISAWQISRLEAKVEKIAKSAGQWETASKERDVRIAGHVVAIGDWEARWNEEADRRKILEQQAAVLGRELTDIAADNSQIRAEIERLKHDDPVVQEFVDIPIPVSLRQRMRDYAVVTGALPAASGSTTD